MQDTVERNPEYTYIEKHFYSWEQLNEFIHNTLKEIDAAPKDAYKNVRWVINTHFDTKIPLPSGNSDSCE